VQLLENIIKWVTAPDVKMHSVTALAGMGTEQSIKALAAAEAV